MPAHHHVMLAKFPGNNHPTIVGAPIFGQQAAVKAGMRLAKKAAGERLGLGADPLLQLLLGLDVRQRHALAPCDVRSFGEVMPKRAFDVGGMRPLPLDAVRVVGVHRPDDLAKRVARLGTGGRPQLRGLLEYSTRGFSQFVQLLRGQQRLELMGLVIDRESHRFLRHGFRLDFLSYAPIIP